MTWQYQYVILPIDTSFNFVMLAGTNYFDIILKIACLDVWSK